MTPEELEASIIQRLNSWLGDGGFRLILQAHNRPLDLTPSNEYDDDEILGFYQTHRWSADLNILYDFVKDLEKLRDLGLIPFYFVGVQPCRNDEEYWAVQLVRPDSEPKWLKEYEALRAAQSKASDESFDLVNGIELG